MWSLETNSVTNENKTERKNNNNFYFNIQLIFAAIILIVSVVLKSSQDYVYIYAKENYREWFETDRYTENNFSYNGFLQKINNELQIRFGELLAVFNSYCGKGSADIFPDNVSTEKYTADIKGVIPVNGYISSPYGIRINPFNKNEKEFHTGIDIASREGTFIRSAFDGYVSKSGYSSIAGNYIRIISENKTETFYAHNQFNFVREGDKILAGQVIATVGQTGYATGPHLHFEFISDSIRYNPVYVLDI